LPQTGLGGLGSCSSSLPSATVEALNCEGRATAGT